MVKPEDTGDKIDGSALRSGHRLEDTITRHKSKEYRFDFLAVVRKTFCRLPLCPMFYAIGQV